jgi:hypothetical protein
MAIMTKTPMQVLSKPSAAPGTSLAYLTIGAIMAVLAGTSYFFFDGSGNPVGNYIRMSFLILGIVLMVIGLTVGHIGRAARKSELPPPEATDAVVRS